MNKFEEIKTAVQKAKELGLFGSLMEEGNNYFKIVNPYRMEKILKDNEQMATALKSIIKKIGPFDTSHSTSRNLLLLEHSKKMALEALDRHRAMWGEEK